MSKRHNKGKRRLSRRKSGWLTREGKGTETIIYKKRTYAFVDKNATVDRLNRERPGKERGNRRRTVVEKGRATSGPRVRTTTTRSRVSQDQKNWYQVFLGWRTHSVIA